MRPHAINVGRYTLPAQTENLSRAKLLKEQAETILKALRISLNVGSSVDGKDSWTPVLKINEISIKDKKVRTSNYMLTFCLKRVRICLNWV